MNKSSPIEKITERPDPDDLQAFLPWACVQMQLPKEVIITKNYQNEYVSTANSERGKVKGAKSKRYPSVVDVDQSKEEVSDKFQDTRLADTVRISAIYDYTENLVGLKFNKNSCIPRQVMQILGLIIKFQVYLTSLIINQGLTKYVLNEIVNFLPNSKITDVCLDNCFLSEGSYFTLLENVTNLRNLSLSRCRITDDVIALITSQLWHPRPGSVNLAVLNLSSNRITDDGVKSIVNALKMNNKLAYLNLADNMITDEGAACIFNVLLEFPLTEDEVREMRKRHIKYLTEKHTAVLQIARDMLMTDITKPRKQTMARSAKVKPKADKDVDSGLPSDKNMFGSDSLSYQKALIQAEHSLPPFKDPYSSENVVSRNGMTYCLGNNTLILLNLSYNSLTFPSVQKLLEVVLYQRDLDRRPKGLLNCRIEGNPLPVGCKELVQIGDVLESGICGTKIKQATIKKKGK